ncbi:PRD domain-containing protein [Paenibacillus etheri]|uniref:PRD domain-containing protein n=1 Tax=Paenibacillus etheri TaxID=1306852 RepID=A0A0W1AWH7_9BACL|nr:PRD domain-containing protein [Paenibacillus etheri]KTD85671.1 hypothetical protein UQ64_19450 [Paenibacillus etheri]
MSLNDRIELLFESEQVDRDTFEQTPNVLKKVEEFLELKLEEENAGSLTSHLMKAIQRIKTNEAVQTCSTALVQQALAKSEVYEFSLELLAPFNIHNSNLDAEAAFIASYLLSLTDEEEV